MNRTNNALQSSALAPKQDNGTAMADDTVSGNNITRLPAADRQSQLRMLEALLFAAAEPLSISVLAERLPEGADVEGLLADLVAQYDSHGVNLVKVAGKWGFRTAEDLSFLLRRDAVEQKRLSRAALETLAIIAYHQPVTRAEIEEVRGVSASRGTLDALLEIGWIRLRGRRRSPGRPVTYGTTEDFLNHFNLESARDLPGMAELKAAGLLDANLPGQFTMPEPAGTDGSREDEDPLDEQPEMLDDQDIDRPDQSG
jgi:segregation and condensation protein B